MGMGELPHSVHGFPEPCQPTPDSTLLGGPVPLESAPASSALCTLELCAIQAASSPCVYCTPDPWELALGPGV